MVVGELQGEQLKRERFEVCGKSPSEGAMPEYLAQARGETRKLRCHAVLFPSTAGLVFRDSPATNNTCAGASRKRHGFRDRPRKRRGRPLTMLAATLSPSDGEMEGEGSHGSMFGVQ